MGRLAQALIVAHHYSIPCLARLPTLLAQESTLRIDARRFVMLLHRTSGATAHSRLRFSPRKSQNLRVCPAKVRMPLLAAMAGRKSLQGDYLCAGMPFCSFAKIIWRRAFFLH